MTAYYNEIDPFCVEWLRNLIAANLIAPGEVDARSIVDVRADDVRGFTQCHFFAGIAAWSHALRLAGWPDDREVWTGSCPCQPFSVAGTKGGFEDDRHLWPVWFKLVAECRPNVVLGEQVANQDALAWLDVVQSDLEATDYAVGTVDICAAGLGAPQLRQRLWWVADAKSDRRGEKRPLPGGDAERDRSKGRSPRLVPKRDVGRLGDAVCEGPQIRPWDTDGRRIVRIQGPTATEAGVVGGFWGGADLIWFQDGKYRPVEPGTFPLAHGVTNRVGRLRATGNALVAPVAEAFIEAVMECEDGPKHARRQS